jgi:hypothetical protein
MHPSLGRDLFQDQRREGFRWDSLGELDDLLGDQGEVPGVKMVFLIVLFCGGAKMAVNRSNADFEGHSKSGKWWAWNSTSKWNYAKALLSVLFSFEGWENGTFVSDRINRLNQVRLSTQRLTCPRLPAKYARHHVHRRRGQRSQLHCSVAQPDFGLEHHLPWLLQH